MMYNLDPNAILNTIAYSYACYLCKEYQKGLDILQKTEKAYPTFHSSLTPQELNNLLIFELEMIIESKDFELLNEFLSKHDSDILDLEQKMFLLARSEEYKQKFDLAAQGYLQLLFVMPENVSYVDKYVENFQKMCIDKNNDVAAPVLPNLNQVIHTISII